MPEIDLEPKDYRAQPIKGEPIFHRGGLTRLFVFAAIIVVSIGTGFLLSPVYSFVRTHMMAPVVCAVIACD